jgi:GAF domain-containing protein
LALLSVPLLREEQIIGSLSLVRRVPGDYSPEVIEVLKTFATQSALDSSWTILAGAGGGAGVGLT